MEKSSHIPWSIIWAKAFIRIRLFMYAGLFLLYYYLLFHEGPIVGFLEGIRQIYFRHLDLGRGQNTGYHFGLISGYLLLPIASLLAQLILIRTRNRYAMLLIISGLEIILTLSREQIPIIGFIILILILLNPSRHYFYPNPSPKDDKSILDDIDF